MGTRSGAPLGPHLVSGGGQGLSHWPIGAEEGHGLPIEPADADLHPATDHPYHLEAQHLPPPCAVFAERLHPGSPAEVLESVGWFGRH